MRGFWISIGAIALAAFTMPAGAENAGPVPESKGAVTAKRAKHRRSGNPRLTLPVDRRSARPIQPPKPRKLTEQEKESLPPPDWVYRYNRRTGEVTLHPPPESPFGRLNDVFRFMPSDPGSLGKGPSRENIIGEDGRQRIVDTTEYPWRTQGKVFFQFPGSEEPLWSASGGLITNFHILTAGHVVYRHEPQAEWVKFIEFVPGMDGDYEPYISYFDINVWATAGWTDHQNPDHDWGLVSLDRPIGEVVGHLGYAYEPDLEWYKAKVFNIAGYPGDLDQGFAQYWSADAATRADGLSLYHLIDTMPGESGAPVWALFPNDQWLAMAVHAYGDVYENSGPQINASRFDILQNWTGGSAYPASLPDLIDDGVEYSWFDPVKIEQGEWFLVHCEIRNIGVRDSGGFFVTFYASPDQVIDGSDFMIGSVYTTGTVPFEYYYEINWSGPFPNSIPDGYYYVGWIIDSTGWIAEYDETNNTAFNPNGLIVGTPPPANVYLLAPDFHPGVPESVAPGEQIMLAGLVGNNGGVPTGEFWLEFWGSRTGGFSKDVFLTSSARMGPYNPGQSESYMSYQPLWGVPDGPYTVVMQADRPNEVAELDDLRDNQAVIGGKRLLVLRPQTGIDLDIQDFAFGPSPVYTGQPVYPGGTVRNTGYQDSGPFWIEFWGSSNRLYPTLDFFVCDSILVQNLPPGGSIDLANYARTLYGTPSGTFMVGVVLDRPDSINEQDETNNYLFIDGIALNTASPAPKPEGEEITGMLPDFTITYAGFSPASPAQLLPGQLIYLTVRVQNQSSYWSATPVWLEFWGSRTGGLNLTELIVDSQHIPVLAPWQEFEVSVSLPLYSIPDGPYTIVAAVDRPNQQDELDESNNRYAIPRDRLLTIRPTTNANLQIEGFSVSPAVLRGGQDMQLGGRVVNTGSDHSGTFWIEFIGTRTPENPNFDMFLCDSIRVWNLAPGQHVNLAEVQRTVYPGIVPGQIGVVCFADRTDLVNEAHEQDNFVTLPGYVIQP